MTDTSRPTTPENQPRDSQRDDLDSSPIKHTAPQVDIDKRDKWSMYVYPEVNKEIKPGSMLLKLCPKYKGINELAPEAPKMEKTKPKSNKSTYCDYLNALSISVRKDASELIEFLPKGDKPMLEHPTQTKCRPDIVAVTQPPKIVPGMLHWSHVCATGEEESEGKSDENREAQEGAYTAYHMQARPDLVSVPGILVGVLSFKLFFANAHWVYHTGRIEWNSGDGRQLLYAWMWRLYHPERDQSITIDTKTSSPTFTVVAGGTAYRQLVVSRAGESIGRRTIVFKRLGPKLEPRRSGRNQGNPSLSTDKAQDLQGGSSPTITISQDPNIVIKEQYVETSRRFREGPILKKIHEVDTFPGVVRLEHHEDVKNNDQEISVEEEPKEPIRKAKRVKTRLVLKDRGTPLEEVGTMREFLMGIYDLLEISRILFRKRGILHRDISHTNILYCQNPVILTESLREDLDDMCFSEYLLEGPATRGDSDPKSDRRRQLTTKVLVIDFDGAEDENRETSPGDPRATDRTGTLIFMARMVRSNEYPAGMHKLPPMPDVSPKLLERYQRTLATRLEDFPANKEEPIDIPEDTPSPTRFKHLLRYDAESVFWYLLWCCIQTQPAGISSKVDIPHLVWSNLTDQDDHEDGRDGHFITKFPKNFLHPAYCELEPLLKEMRTHLRGDLSYAKDEGRKTDEYLHEVFQRLILNFLDANSTKEFMRLPKHEQRRGVNGNPMDRPSKSTAVTGRRSRQEYEGEPVNSSDKHARIE